METSLLPALLHIYAKNEHVGIIEWSICTIKECARSTYHTATFKIYTSIITISPIEVVLYLMNRLQYKYGVSDTLSPSTIVEVRPNLDMGQKKIYFGLYLVVHIGKNNTIKTRCVLVIALKASNDSGRYYFMNIFTGK